MPLPTGLVVDRTDPRSGGRLIAYGRVRGDFHAVMQFFNARLPAAGFRQRNGEIDRHDAESDFIGRTVRGRWTAGLSPKCKDQSSVTLIVQPGAYCRWELGLTGAPRARDGLRVGDADTQSWDTYAVTTAANRPEGRSSPASQLPPHTAPQHGSWAGAEGAQARQAGPAFGRRHRRPVGLQLAALSARDVLSRGRRIWVTGGQTAPRRVEATAVARNTIARLMRHGNSRRTPKVGPKRSRRMGSGIEQASTRSRRTAAATRKRRAVTPPRWGQKTGTGLGQPQPNRHAGEVGGDAINAPMTAPRTMIDRSQST